MRIVLLAVDDAFAGLMQEPLFAAHPDWVVGSVIARHSLFKKNVFQAAAFIIRTSGLVFFLEMFRMKILRKLAGGSDVTTPSKLAARHGVETFVSTNINDAESRARLEAWRPDVVISTNFSHYIGLKARKIARYGTWNLHKAFLPEYRGMAPSFHALREGAPRVGVTLHVVAKGFDTGDIIVQEEIPIGPEDSVYSLNRRTAEVGGRMMARFLDSNELALVKPRPQPEGDWNEYTYPTPAEVGEFRRKGLRF